MRSALNFFSLTTAKVFPTCFGLLLLFSAVRLKPQTQKQTPAYDTCINNRPVHFFAPTLDVCFHILTPDVSVCCFLNPKPIRSSTTTAFTAFPFLSSEFTGRPSFLSIFVCRKLYVRRLMLTWTTFKVDPNLKPAHHASTNMSGMSLYGLR